VRLGTPFVSVPSLLESLHADWWKIGRATPFFPAWHGVSVAFTMINRFNSWKLALQLHVPASPKKHPSYCTRSVRVLRELGAGKVTSRRSKGDDATRARFQIGSRNCNARACYGLMTIPIYVA
jgi:hypothetical protein